MLIATADLLRNYIWSVLYYMLYQSILNCWNSLDLTFFRTWPTPVETSPGCEPILFWTENYGYEWTVVLLKRDVHSEWDSTPESISVKSRTFPINVMFIYVERNFFFSKHLEWLFDCSAVSKVECNQKKSLHSPWRSIK